MRQVSRPACVFVGYSYIISPYMAKVNNLFAICGDLLGVHKMTNKNLYNSPYVANRIKFFAKSKAIPLKTILDYCELGSNTFSHMLHGRSLAFDSLALIADYLDCSVDYLLGRTDIPEVNRGYEASEEFYRDDLQLVAFGGDFKGKPKKKETQTT